jgi:hypothetical protein
MHLPTSSQRREHNIDVDVIDGRHSLRFVCELVGLNSSKSSRLLTLRYGEQRSVAETREDAKRNEAEFQNMKANVTTHLWEYYACSVWYVVGPLARHGPQTLITHHQNNQQTNSLASVRREDSTLIQNQQTSNRSTAECAQDTGDQRTDSQTRNVASTARSDLGKHTDLRAERANVAETAETVCRDELGASGHFGVGSLVNEGGEGEVLVLRIWSA